MNPDDQPNGGHRAKPHTNPQPSDKPFPNASQDTLRPNRTRGTPPPRPVGRPDIGTKTNIRRYLKNICLVQPDAPDVLPPLQRLPPPPHSHQLPPKYRTWPSYYPESPSTKAALRWERKSSDGNFNP